MLPRCVLGAPEPMARMLVTPEYGNATLSCTGFFTQLEVPSPYLRATYINHILYYLTAVFLGLRLYLPSFYLILPYHHTCISTS